MKQKVGEKKSLMTRCLDGIERVGNKLPHPVTLFGILCLVVIICSTILSLAGVSVQGELINKATGQLEMQTINIVNLLSPEGIQFIFTKMVTNFTSFAPLGVVLVGMLGIGVAESSGYIGTGLKKIVSVTPEKLIVPMTVFLGIMSNVASDAGYVVLIPLGALIFLAYGRHPIAGIVAAFAGVSGGFSANLLVGTLDPMLSELTNEAIKLIDPTQMINPTANYFFMIVSTFLITFLGTIITTKIIEPKLGKYEGNTIIDSENDLRDLKPEEQKALTIANRTLYGMLIALVILTLIPGSFLRNLNADSYLNSIISGSTLINGLIPIIAILFFVPSVVYGKISGSIKNDKDVVAHMNKAMASMAGYLVLAFAAAQFIAYFNYSNLGTMIAIAGADLLKAADVGYVTLFIGFILVTAFINLFMGSASAKWAIMAPIFIPMFMRLGMDPAEVQTAYRIADSSTNIISPLMAYFAMVIMYVQTYDKKAGIGTIVSLMLPYSISFLILWSAGFLAWISLGLPVGF
ncbi:MAG: aminobenzoyl-glutamate transporter [Candidatus Epulonipiscioides saccharophilum]|nr:MAG: aminobenzoyl-glutamate transporter [Epulopiscium sp. AS2M-Bin001]